RRFDGVAQTLVPVADEPIDAEVVHIEEVTTDVEVGAPQVGRRLSDHPAGKRGRGRAVGILNGENHGLRAGRAGRGVDEGPSDRGEPLAAEARSLLLLTEVEEARINTESLCVFDPEAATDANAGAEVADFLVVAKKDRCGRVAEHAGAAARRSERARSNQ